jgi:two-component system chemotaxis response regulator CheB
MVKVLVVDDSAFARSRIVKVLSESPGLQVVGQAVDGADAIRQTKELQPDVVTLDVEMPVMDGLTALEQMMRECPTPVVMVSSLTGPQADATVAALQLGAVDFFLKPSIALPAGTGVTQSDLAKTVMNAATVKVRRLDGKNLDVRTASTGAPKTGRARPGSIEQVVLIGSSTGGPKALAAVIPGLPGDLPAAVMVIQHMPAGFTTSLADRLNRASALQVSEATEGDRIGAGKVLLAPGGYHMLVDMSGMISLDEGPPVCGVRPSVDVTALSAVEAFGKNMRAMILTGMGSDGTNGAAAIKAAGGKVSAEHQSTCAVYGMPRSVVEAGWADDIVPLDECAGQIVKMCSE